MPPLTGSPQFRVNSWLFVILSNGLFAFLPFLVDQTILQYWDIHFNYYGLLTLCIVYFYGVYRFLSQMDWQGKFWKTDWPRLGWNVLLSAGGLFLILRLTFPTFRILYDEIDFVGISRSMFNHHSTQLCSGGEFNLDLFTCNFWTFNVRGALFPFLLNLLHGVVGFSAQNSFLFNGICGFLIFYIGFLILDRFGYSTPHKAAWLFILLAFPSISHAISSGGVGPAFLVCLLFLFYLIEKQDRSSFFLAVLNLAFLATLRNEAIALLIMIGPFLIFTLNRLRTSQGQFPLECYFLALLFYPAVIHDRCIPLDTLQGGESPFSMSHWVPNSFANLNYLSGINPWNSTQLFHFVFFTIGILVMLKRISIWKKESHLLRTQQYLFAGAFAFSAVGLWFLYGSYYLSNFSIPGSSRFALPFLVAMSFVIIYGLRSLTNRLFTGSLIHLPVVLCFAAFLSQAGAITQDVEAKLIAYPHEQRILYRYLDQQPNLRDALVIYGKPQVLLAKNVSSYSYEQTLLNWPQILKAYQAKHISKIMLITGRECKKETDIFLPSPNSPNVQKSFEDCARVKELLKDRLQLKESLHSYNNMFLEIYEVAR